MGLYVGWGGVTGESLRWCQTVLARLMEFQIFAGFVGGGFRIGTMASAHLDARQFSFSLYTTGAFLAATPVLELRERHSE